MTEESIRNFCVHSCLLILSFKFWHSHEIVPCMWTYSSMSQQKNDKNRWCIRLRHLTQYGFLYFVYYAFWTPSPTLPTTYKISQYTFHRVYKSFHTLHSQTGTIYQWEIKKKKHTCSLCYLHCEYNYFPRIKKKKKLVHSLFILETNS
jgi:hypothetical protein